jgi:hypothetical protein
MLIFLVLYLASRDLVMDLTKEQHQMLCISQNCATETLAMIRQVFREESTSYTQKVKTDIEKCETGEEQSQEHTY